LFGWAAYVDLRQRLEATVGAVLAHHSHLTIGFTFNNLGKTYWQLSCDLDGVRDDDMPPALSPHATAHLAAAKTLFRWSMVYCDKLPVGFCDERLSKEALTLQARQGWAYCVASGPRIATPTEWQDALAYSEDALKETLRRNALNERLHAEWAPQWIDTYLFVRVVYARPRELTRTELVTAQHELNRAMLFYQRFADDPRYHAALARFAPYLSGTPGRPAWVKLRGLLRAWGLPLD
jgi:hypothetical protein